MNSVLFVIPTFHFSSRVFKYMGINKTGIKIHGYLNTQVFLLHGP
jgi:hypothetical protein